MTSKGLFDPTKTMNQEIRSMSGSQMSRLIKDAYGKFADDVFVLEPIAAYDVALKIAILVDRGLYQYADHGISYALMSVGNRAWRVLQNMLNDGGPDQYFNMHDGNFVKIAIKAAREEH